MLAELAAVHPEVKATFDEASSGAGVDLWDISQQGPLDRLNATENTQPALLAASVAVWRVWRKLGGATPAMLSGHSLGEYSALVVAGALSLHDAAALVAERGRLMQAAVPAGTGSMAAILGGDDAQIAEVCAEVAQGQVVTTCMLMRDAADRLGERMAGVDWHKPSIPVVQNADARVHGDIADIRGALQRQLYLPVRWTECVQALAGAGVTRVAECGPGKVLAGLIKRIDKSIEARAIGTPAELDAARTEWSA